MSLYSWGANSHGQLGLGFESELCIVPQRISRLPFNVKTIRSIKGGGGHVLVLDNDGQLYACGWNNRGQLGLNCKDDKNEFTPISKDCFDGSAIDQIACGWDNSSALSKDKRIYVWGSNAFQQLGLCQRGFSSVSQPIRLRLPRDEIPTRISFGLRHFCVLTDENKIYVFGRIRVNETHLDLHCSRMPFNRTEILKIQPAFKADIVVSGQNHLLISDRFKVIGIGENKYGQANAFVSESRIKKIVSGWTHNAILTNSQEVFLWGRNSYGQIGCRGTERFASPNKLSLSNEHVPSKLHLGSEHGLIVASNGTVLTWGWNEHGNCGNGNTENLFQPTVIKLPEKCCKAGIGAGFCFAVCGV